MSNLNAAAIPAAGDRERAVNLGVSFPRATRFERQKQCLEASEQLHLLTGRSLNSLTEIKSTKD